MTELYIPGLGVTDVLAVRANNTSKAYDHRLSFKLNPMTQQYCSYMEMPRGWDPPEIPVKGWDHIPSEDELNLWLAEHDAEKHGDELRTAMNKRNAQRKAEQVYANSEHNGDVADHLDHIIRKSGEHPWHRSLRKIPKK